MDISHHFLMPRNATHRQYEALRAFFVDKLSETDIAKRFGYTLGSFKVLCSNFRTNPERSFFMEPKHGPQAAPKRDPVRDLVVTLRKQNLSIYDISRALEKENKNLSSVSVSRILQEEGFTRLPRRRDDERPAGIRPTTADMADVAKLVLAPRKFRTQFGGLFLFAPYLAAIPLDTILEESGFPGSNKVPPAHAIRALLGLKLYGNARHSHVMSHVFDEGLALFAGLNVIPKRAFLTEYSCRVDPAAYPKLMERWFDAIGELGLGRGTSFDLDFHTIPFHGEDAIMEKHYISKRSRRQKGVLAIVVNDTDIHAFCYGRTDIRKREQNDEVVRFIEFWRQRTGRYPEELIFDSRFTTYANLNRLNQLGIRFITLRRRSKELMEMARLTEPSAWRRISLSGVSRAYRTPRILDQHITLSGYEGTVRQLTIVDLGHEEPVFLITNHLRRSPSRIVDRYAQRMVIENSIADGIDFFHMDALSSAVPMKVNLDLQLTLMASSLYRLFGRQIGKGYESSKARTIFRDFIQASAAVTITKNEIEVRFQKRAHNPLLIAAGLPDRDVSVPWLGERKLRLILG